MTLKVAIVSHPLLDSQRLVPLLEKGLQDVCGDMHPLEVVDLHEALQSFVGRFVPREKRDTKDSLYGFYRLQGLVREWDPDFETSYIRESLGTPSHHLVLNVSSEEAISWLKQEGFFVVSLSASSTYLQKRFEERYPGDVDPDVKTSYMKEVSVAPCLPGETDKQLSRVVLRLLGEWLDEPEEQV